MTAIQVLLYLLVILVALTAVLILVGQVFVLFVSGKGIVTGRVSEYRESIKTSTITVTAWLFVLLAFIGWWMGGRIEPPDVNSRINQPMFASFGPIDVAKIEIVSFDVDKNKQDVFRVEQQGSGWKLPSHKNYPADAEEQVRATATSLLNLVVTDVVPEEDIDHRLFGVVEPTEEAAQQSQNGLGTRVTLRDKNNSELASLIVGKTVRDGQGTRFVRIPQQDPVYIVQYDVSVLKTEFPDWIDSDLLQLDGFKIDTVTIRDYQVDPKRAATENVADITRQYDLTVQADFNDWQLKSLVEYDGQQPNDRTLVANEKLNKPLLDQMRTALDNLSILDVEPKPDGLRDNLSAGRSILNDNESLPSLMLHGFVPVGSGDNLQVLSTNGEMVVLTKDGIEYELRFGNIKLTQGTTDGKLNRYMMVTTRVNEDVFPIPIRGQTPGGNDADPGDDGVTLPGGDSDGQDDGDASPSTPPLEQEQESTEAGGAADDLEYDRLLDERTEKIRLANKEVARLNARFAGWYYIIAEDSFKQLRIPKAEIVTNFVPSGEQGSDE